MAKIRKERNPLKTYFFKKKKEISLLGIVLCHSAPNIVFQFGTTFWHFLDVVIFFIFVK